MNYTMPTAASEGDVVEVNGEPTGGESGHVEA